MSTLRTIALALVAQVIGVACAASDLGWPDEPAESGCGARCPAGATCNATLGVCLPGPSTTDDLIDVAPTHVRISGESVDVIFVSQSPATGGRGEAVRVVLVPLDSQAPPQEMATLSAEQAVEVGRWLAGGEP